MTCELTSIDRHFADFICRQAGTTDLLLRLAAALVSNVTGNGHICLHLGDLAGTSITVDGVETQLPLRDELRDRLTVTPVVGAPGAFRPLVLDADGRLYLYRYWQYQRDLAGVIREKAAAACDIDDALLGEGLARLFPASGGEIDWQKIAAAAAVRRRFCVISGGPGTGKTSTVVKILALLAEQAHGGNLRIAMAAPTGKAAARLKESVAAMKEKLPCAAQVTALIPDGVSTLHRLLGSRGTSVRFRNGEDNLLPWDVVIVDEASMVALPLMAKLAKALKPTARLILLGDRDQLASVEAGAVLGDICGRGRPERFSPRFAEFLATVAGETLPAEMVDEAAAAPLRDCLVVLRKNYRFAGVSGIGMLARTVNAGNGVAALGLLATDSPAIAWHVIPRPEYLKRELTDKVIAGYGAYLNAGTPEEALKLFDAFRLLCALRQGPYGVAGINSLIEGILAGAGLIAPHDRWYRGRPVMVTVNDYNLKLFNGDIGIVFPDSEADGTPKVCFSAPDGGIRKVSPVRLPAHETVFAMTVHKSQGSEFGRVLLLLPDTDSEVLSRELIYTGLTRARSGVEIWGTEEGFTTAAGKTVSRDSGLEDALWTG